MNGGKCQLITHHYQHYRVRADAHAVTPLSHLSPYHYRSAALYMKNILSFYILPSSVNNISLLSLHYRTSYICFDMEKIYQSMKTDH